MIKNTVIGHRHHKKFHVGCFSASGFPNLEYNTGDSKWLHQTVVMDKKGNCNFIDIENKQEKI